MWQAEREEDDWGTNIHVGSLDNPADARPSSHIYVNTQLPWYQLCEDLPKFGEEDEDAMMEFIKEERGIEL